MKNKALEGRAALTKWVRPVSETGRLNGLAKLAGTPANVTTLARL